MPEIKRSFSFLKINGYTIENNFTFKTSRSVGSLKKTSSIDIKKSVFLKNGIEINIGDTVSLFSKNNNEDLVELFNGSVTDFSMTTTEIHIESMFCCVDNEELHETYKDTTFKDVLSKFVSKLKYEARDKELKQIILQGTKEHSLNCLLCNKHFYIDLDNTLVVQDKPKIGKTYSINALIDNPRPNKFAIFPIFGLDINDLIKIQNITYLVKGITLDSLFDYKMIIEGIIYKEDTDSPPADNKEIDQKQDELEQDETDKALFASGKIGVTYKDLLNQLNDQAKIHINEIAQEVRNEMGDSFESIVITSVWRSKDSQINILLGKLDKKKNEDNSLTDNMYEYYRYSAPACAPYFKVIQNLYEGVYFHKVVPENGVFDGNYYLYEIDLDVIELEKRIIFQEIIERKDLSGNYVVDSYVKNKTAIKWLLEESYINSPVFLFNPSFHVIGTIEKNDSYAIDLRISPSSDKLKKYHDTSGKGGSYKVTSKGDPHIHLTYRKPK